MICAWSWGIYILAAAIVRPDGCWEWPKTRRDGYGVSPGASGERLAHRLSYREFVGALDPTLEIDHLCRNRRCVRPAHLEQVTCRINLLRGDTVTAYRAAQTHCHKGHSFDERNTKIRANGTRNCRACEADAANHRYHHRHPEAPYRTRRAQCAS